MKYNGRDLVLILGLIKDLPDQLKNTSAYSSLTGKTLAMLESMEAP